METHLTLHPTGRFGVRGEIYQVLLDGEVIASGVSPEFNACREMQKRGLTGFACFWRAGAEKTTWDIRMKIDTGATKTVMENVKAGPRVVKWNPFEEVNHPTE